MKRPWHAWLIYGMCVVILMAVMVWITATMKRLEKENEKAQHMASLEETVRLALWRMDAAITPLIIEESSRSYADYTAFKPAYAVYPFSVEVQESTPLVPSPLLTQSSSNVFTYFNCELPDGRESPRITSPGVPDGELLNLAINNFNLEPQLAANDRMIKEFSTLVSGDALRQAFEIAESQQDDTQNEAPEQQLAQKQYARSQQPQLPQAARLERQISGRNILEWSARKGQQDKAQSKVRVSKQSSYFNYQSRSNEMPAVGVTQQTPFQLPNAAKAISEDIMRPLWVDDVLVLARKVTVDGDSFIQGLWLNWESIREELLSEVRDLLPDAKLVPVRDLEAGVPSRMLAALPVELQPGEPAFRTATASSPLSAPLLIAWLCVVAAAGAVGLVLIGAVTLSERRAAFVSAVTHELRTPLTTFQMYAEMLEQGMVGDPDRQREYLATLRAEGSRLSHLVENVLSFSRIEKGNSGGHPERTTLADLVETMRDRLTTRAKQADMQLVVSGDPGGATEVHVDRSMTEQILYNLVDNACKYAAKADDRRIHIELENGNRRGIIRIRDHGPGIASSEARRLFRPFHKSAKNAAESAPGVGLGLALSRRLAHQMKGDLRIEASVNGGACFELILPAKLPA